MAHPLPGAEIISSLPLCLTALARIFERPLPILAFSIENPTPSSITSAIILEPTFEIFNDKFLPCPYFAALFNDYLIIKYTSLLNSIGKTMSPKSG